MHSLKINAKNRRPKNSVVDFRCCFFSLENWLKLSAESISIKILLTEIHVNQMTRCGSFSAACCQTTSA